MYAHNYIVLPQGVLETSSTSTEGEEAATCIPSEICDADWGGDKKTSRWVYVIESVLLSRSWRRAPSLSGRTPSSRRAPAGRRWRAPHH